MIHELLFAVELTSEDAPSLRGPDVLANLSPTPAPDSLLAAVSLPEPTSWLNHHGFTPFIDEVRTERIAEHVELSLTEVLQRVERLASALILPHPERETLEVRRLRPHPETERAAAKSTTSIRRPSPTTLTSPDPQSAELGLLAALAGLTGSILPTPNERRVADERHDCHCLYVAANRATVPILQKPIPDPAHYPWHEVTKVAHYYLSVNALKQPMEVRETEKCYDAEL